MKYRVHFETVASLSVTVEIPDDTDPDDIHEVAIDTAYNEIPGGICAQCSGWGQDWNFDIGEYDLAKDFNGREITPEPAD